MNLTLFCKTSFRSALIVAGLAAGPGVGIASAASADAAIPQPQSDSPGAAVADTVITTRVKARLMGEDSIRKSDVSVTTINGVVTLDGSVNSAGAKSLAETAAKSVDGVKSLDSQLKTPVGSDASAKTREVIAETGRVVSDSWTTTKVKSVILADSVSKGFDVNVRTIRGVVVLKGILANQDAVNHVKDIAEKADGVKSVDTSALVVAGR